MPAALRRRSATAGSASAERTASLSRFRIGAGSPIPAPVALDAPLPAWMQEEDEDIDWSAGQRAPVPGALGGEGLVNRQRGPTVRALGNQNCNATGLDSFFARPGQQ